MINSIQIKHGFALRSHGLTELFDDTNKMSTFMYKLEKQSRIDPDRYDPNKYVGDGFEFFVEIFLKSHCYDNRVGITGYEPVESEDNGVDGVGYNMIGEKCAVQVKYRGNTLYHLTTNQDHLGNMVVDAMMKFDIIKPVNKNCIPRYYVVTTAKGLHYYTDNEVFKGYVKCIGINDLKYMLDGNLSFWNMCREVVSKIDPKINKIKIGDLDISVRCFQSLKKMNIQYLNEISNYSPDDLKISKKTKDEIDYYLEKYKLNWKI